MRRRLALLLTIALLLLTAHRLPAPIREESSPTPIPKSKVKVKLENHAQETKKKEPTLAPFVGTWTGPVAASFTSTVGLNGSGNATRTVIISSNGGVIYFGQSQGQTGPQRQSRVVLSKDGHAVSWTDQLTEQGGTGRETCSLQLSGPNAAYYRENAVFSSADGSGSINATGTLTKQ